MKKIFMFLFICMFILSFAVPAFAQEISEDGTQPAAYAETAFSDTEPETQNASQPRFMVTSYECGVLTPSESGEVTIRFKNYSSEKAVCNIKLSVSDESGDIRAEGTGTKYVDQIKAGGTYKWSLPVTVAKTAATGEHKLAVTAEYEDEYYTAFSSSDTLAVTVAQSVSIAYDGLSLPQKVTQGETQSLSVNFMNTGKSVIRNCTVRFEVEGLQTGGVLFAGEIPIGESKEATANFNISADMLGETSGKAVLSYEDEMGNAYSETIGLSTVIEEPPVQEEEIEQEEQVKYPLWWLFLLIGVVAGGAVGFAVPAAVRAHKQRLEDEKRL